MAHNHFDATHVRPVYIGPTSDNARRVDVGIRVLAAGETYETVASLPVGLLDVAACAALSRRVALHSESAMMVDARRIKAVVSRRVARICSLFVSVQIPAICRRQAWANHRTPMQILWAHRCDLCGPDSLSSQGGCTHRGLRSVHVETRPQDIQDWSGTSSLGWRAHREQTRLCFAAGARSSESQQRLCARASLGHGGAHWTFSHSRRDDPPQERCQDRQPNRESRIVVSVTQRRPALSGLDDRTDRTADRLSPIAVGRTRAALGSILDATTKGEALLPALKDGVSAPKIR